MRYFVFLLLAAFNMSAFAASCTYYIMADGVTTTTSASAACESQLPALREHYSNLSVEFTGTFGSPPSRCDFKVTGSNGHVYETPSRSLEYTTKECGDQCAPNAGKTSMLNFTAGWARSATPNSGDHVGELSFPAPGATFCVEGCTVETGNVDNCYRADVAAPTGLHRISCDYSMVGKGTQCTASAADAAHDKTQPPLPCPGFVGEVNGQTTCVGTASNPIPPPSGPGVTQATGENEDKGNPTAGTKPSSGEGSGTGGAGRTPSTGSGTAAGGPAAAAGSGTKPDGTVPKPDDGEEQAACGAPGQPKCGIDEGGTPGKFDGDKAALDGWKSSVEANRNTIKDTDGSFFNSFDLFFSAPPVVACEAIELPNEQVITRHCDVVEGTRSVMSYIWALAAIWLCLGWIREAI